MFNLKQVFVCLVCLLLTVFTHCQSSSPRPDKVGEYFYYKCYNQTQNLNTFNYLRDNFTDYINDLAEGIALVSEKKNIFCESRRQQLDAKIEVVAKLLGQCVSSEEKYLPDFVRNGFKETTHFLCHNNGENTEAMWSPNEKQCRDNLSRSNYTVQVKKCFEKIFKPLSGHLTKRDLCEDISVAEKCFIATLKEQCPSSSYENLIHKYFKYISVPCSDLPIRDDKDSGCAAQLNIVLLILSVLLSYSCIRT